MESRARILFKSAVFQLNFPTQVFHILHGRKSVIRNDERILSTERYNWL